jgi:hypothetical protein
MVWVKFHDELRRGAKRGISRAARFVLMELSLEARPNRGYVDLPIGMHDLEAIHDMLGGNKRDIAEALSVFTSGTDPSFVIEDTDTGRRLTILKWALWNSVEAPGSSTERSRRARATPEQRSCNGDATAVAPPVQRSRNARATLPEEKKSREDKINLPPKEGETVDSSPGGGDSAVSADEPEEVMAIRRFIGELPALAQLATLRFARQVATHCSVGGNTGRLELGDALMALRKCGERHAGIVAGGQPPWSREALIGSVVTYLQNTRRGEARESPARGKPNYPRAVKSDVQRGGWNSERDGNTSLPEELLNPTADGSPW